MGQVSQLVETIDALRAIQHMTLMEDSSVSLLTFVEKSFIPNHVALKSPAGQMHYHAILKYILKPEAVELLFAPNVKKRRARLRSVPGWPYLNDIRVSEISVDHIRQLVVSAFARGYSPQTVKHIKNVMGAIISHAKRERAFRGDNPALNVKLPPLTHSRTRDLTINEARAILRSLKYPEREIALVSMTTGMSATDICALRWKDVNLGRSPAYIDGEMIPPCGILVGRHSDSLEQSALGADGVKVVVVPPCLIRALQKSRKDRGIMNPDALVIATLQGDPVQPATAREHGLKPIGKELKMPWLSWQVLRRAHGALLSELRLQLTDDLVENTR